MHLCILRPLRAIAWNLAHKRCLAPLCPCHQISNPYFWTPSFALRALHKALHRWLNFEVPIGRGIILDQAFLNKGATPAWARVCGRSPAVPSRKVAPQKYASSKWWHWGVRGKLCGEWGLHYWPGAHSGRTRSHLLLGDVAMTSHVVIEDSTIDQVRTLGRPDQCNFIIT